MSSDIIPDGADVQVAQMALAWKLVEMSGVYGQFNKDPEHNLKLLTSVYNRTLQALASGETIAPEAKP